jgi:RNA polymerase sigma factor FliA
LATFHQPRAGGEQQFPRRPGNRPEDGRQALSPAVARLIEVNLPYAHAIAAEVTRKLPPELEKKDIQGWAELGLVEAAISFDRTRGIQFTTFAHYRIKGAIYDGLRKMGWYPKGQYRRMRFEMAATEYLKDASQEPQRAASPEAQLQDLRDLTGNLMSCYMLSLDSLDQEPVDSAQLSAEELVVHSQQRARLRQLLTQLPKINREVLEHCYFKELTLEEVGKRLGMSKSWVCRLHAKSLEMLRKMLTQEPGAAPLRRTATFSDTIR